MKTIKYLTTIALLLLLLAAASCNKDSSEPEPTCVFDDPLTDLPWLKERVDIYKEAAEKDRLHGKIYQCTYRYDTEADAEIGFYMGTDGNDLGGICCSCFDMYLLNCEGKSPCYSLRTSIPWPTSCWANFTIDNLKLIFEALPTPLASVDSIYKQPLSVIKECVYGKWKLFKIGGQYYYNTFVDISENSVVVSGDEDLNYSFSYTWREMKQPYCDMTSDSCMTHVMWDSEEDEFGWCFEDLCEDHLVVIKIQRYNDEYRGNFFLPKETFGLHRIIDNNQ